MVVETAQLGETARHYQYDANGTTVELFAVKASDGSVRLALNTCQVCNGSPYVYFVQENDQFTCQNCGNRFATGRVGLVSGGILERVVSAVAGVTAVKADFEKGSLWVEFSSPCEEAAIRRAIEDAGYKVIARRGPIPTAAGWEC